MKFFLDENFPRPALIQLQSAGHSALHALEISPPGTADDVLFDHAQKAGAVFVTTDKDFFHTVPAGIRAAWWSHRHHLAPPES
jgi:predicted nuclease of predicted toxin-antitoxin system